MFLPVLALMSCRNPTRWYGSRKEHAMLQSLKNELNALSSQRASLQQVHVESAWGKFVACLNKVGLSGYFRVSWQIEDLTKKIESKKYEIDQYESNFNKDCSRRAKITAAVLTGLEVYGQYLQYQESVKKKAALEEYKKLCEENIANPEHLPISHIFSSQCVDGLQDGSVCGLWRKCLLAQKDCKRELPSMPSFPHGFRELNASASIDSLTVFRQRLEEDRWNLGTQTKSALIDGKLLPGLNVSEGDLCGSTFFQEQPGVVALKDGCRFSKKEGFDAWFAPLLQTASFSELNCKDIAKKCKNLIRTLSLLDPSKPFVQSYCPTRCHNRYVEEFVSNSPIVGQVFREEGV